jgi:hypothetical protein
VATINGAPASAGDHICVFYRGRAERDRLIVPFLQEGLRAGHKCICIMPPADHDRISTLLMGNPDDPMDAELLQMERFDTTYLRSGSFLGEQMLAYWRDWAEQTFVREGRKFARGVSDMSWAFGLESGEMLDDFIRYETAATRFARSFPQVALCLYDLDLFGGDVIIPVLRVHPKVLFSGILVDNPYFVDPDEP